MTNKLIKRKNWVECPGDENLIKKVAQKYNLSSSVAKTVLNRCSDDYDFYLTSDSSVLNDPYLMKGMKEAVERIREAIQKKQKITVYGDYDVDGITSTYMVYDYLLNCGASADYFIPDRMDSGYGLSDSAIHSLKQKGTELIVTVDLGISAINEAVLCRKLGIDLIITDHHSLQGDGIPECIAVINPKIPSDYPFCHLAGAGVAYKLICALSDNSQSVSEKYLPFAAIGTIADLVELTGENRYIAKKGLELLKSTDNIGLKALFEVSKIDTNKVSASSIGFAIGPRLNAAGRIASASTSVSLLASHSKEDALKTANELESENEKRKACELEILNEALDIIKKENLHKDEVIVVANPGWHHGVIGIVSSRITDTFYKPSIVMSIDETTAKASGRSIKGFNLFDALDLHRDFLVKYGGHELAAGLTIENSKIDDFRTAINNYATTIITEEISTPTIYIDDTITLKDVSLDTLRQLKCLEPCGMGNRSPVYCIKELTITSLKHLKDSSHSFLTLSDKYGNTSVMPAFGMQSIMKRYKEGNVVDVAGILSENTYNSRTMSQFIIKDIRPSFHRFVTRDDVGNVYRAVKNSVTDSSFESTNEGFEDIVYNGCHIHHGIVKVSVCLDILKELGMIDYCQDEERIKIHELNGFFKQTNLEKSSTYNKYSLKK